MEKNGICRTSEQLTETHSQKIIKLADYILAKQQSYANNHRKITLTSHEPDTILGNGTWDMIFVEFQSIFTKL
jgi:hypothetical protein